MKKFNLLIAGLFVFLSFPTLSLADSAGEITVRMQQRLTQIDDLKLAGKVGENNKGYLEARISLSDREQAIISGENSDRKALYKIVAQKTDKSLDEVAKQRAIRIAQQSSSGVWLQDASGDWYRNP